MPLQRILQSLDSSVRPEVIKHVLTYMTSMPPGNEDLISQCVTHLDNDQSLGAMLAVVHALNRGEFLLRSHAVDETAEEELSDDFEELFREAVGK
jgi:hypothetical protein